MADKADQALKLAQKLEKDLQAMEKRLIELHNKQETKFSDAINERDKKATDLHNEQTKRMNEMDKKSAELHNQQAKEMSAIKDWAMKTFDTKGWF